jgi:hypothetical protein
LKIMISTTIRKNSNSKELPLTDIK